MLSLHVLSHIHDKEVNLPKSCVRQLILLKEETSVFVMCYNITATVMILNLWTDMSEQTV